MRDVILGTTYYATLNPRDELRGNLTAMREHGIDVVRTAEFLPGWEYIERREGRFDFADLDNFVDVAGSVGLRVIMGVGVSDPPVWLFGKHPDARFVDGDGRCVKRRVHCACFDHPGVRSDMERFIREVSAHFSTCEALCGWQFGNEVRYGVRCACAHTTRAFREWLKERYALIDVVNDLWATTYSDWAEIQCYGSREGAPTHGIQGLWMDYRRFLSWSMAEFVCWGTRLIKEHDRRPVFHNNYDFSGHGRPEGLVAPDHWLLAEAVDVPGIDVYPPRSRDPRFRNAWALDLLRSSARGKEYWVLETAAGQYGTYVRFDSDAGVMVLNALECAACGVRGVLFFPWKSSRYEQPHKFTGAQGMLRHDGSETRYAGIPLEVRRQVSLYGEQAPRARPKPARAAIYYPEESFYLGEEAGFAGLAHRATFGAYKSFYDTMIPVDFVRSEDILADRLGSYRLVYLPYSPVLPRGMGARLSAWVESGGTLVSEARVGYVDEAARVYPRVPGDGLWDLFGACEDHFYMTGAADLADLEPAPGRAGRIAVREVRCSLSSLRPDARVIGSYASGEAFATLRRVGAGRAILLGGCLGLTVLPGQVEGAGGVHVEWDGEGAVFQRRAGAREPAPDEPGHAWDEGSAISDAILVLAQSSGIGLPWELSSATPGVSGRWLEATGRATDHVLLLNYSPRYGRLCFSSEFEPTLSEALPRGATARCSIDEQGSRGLGDCDREANDPPATGPLAGCGPAVRRFRVEMAPMSACLLTFRNPGADAPHDGRG